MLNLWTLNNIAGPKNAKWHGAQECYNLQNVNNYCPDKELMSN